ncbi:MAG TPA: FtsH protease activity modulator HflK [Caulobacteraceae bacterium]|nr:FtsH protease activity modulator HflK [Caulobacteraceae bacterium]
MPWNDNANPGPWGQPPEGGGGKSGGPGSDGDEPQPRREEPRRHIPPPQGTPDPAALLRRLMEELRRAFSGPAGQGVRPGAIAAVAGVVFLLWTFTGVYTVQAYQEAVITRFGGYARSVGPGLHFHLPIPIERAELVSVTNQNKTVIGGTSTAEAPDESLMLTGDENIVDLSFTVQWHVSDAPAYLFRVRDPDDAVKAVAESAMREVVGRSALKSILTNGRGQVQAQTLILMQKILDGYHAGVTIDAVQIQNANPPAEVVPAYQDIARAGQDAQSNINVANTYRNRVVNEAKGDAAKIVQAAQGYREKVILEARGQASRFNALYAQYRLAPAVTRERLYIETMQGVLANSSKVIIDAKGATTPIILPADAFHVKSSDDAAPPPPARGGTGRRGR